MAILSGAQQLLSPAKQIVLTCEEQKQNLIYTVFQYTEPSTMAKKKFENFQDEHWLAIFRVHMHGYAEGLSEQGCVILEKDYIRKSGRRLIDEWKKIMANMNKM